MIKSVDQGHVGAMLLDMSAAFATVDHTIMLDILSRRFGVQDEAHHWLEDVLLLTVARPSIPVPTSPTTSVITFKFGVPQGSVIGPKRFIEYVEDVV